MGLLNWMNHRADVMTKMAQTLGVDFSEKIVANERVAAQYKDAVLRCSMCKHEGDCTGWMAENQNADHTPSYCSNKALLERLAAE